MQNVLLYSTFTSLQFRLGTLNVGTIRGRAEEAVKTLTRRKVDVCCVPEVRWKGASARLISGKNNEYRMYWVGNNLGLSGVGVLVTGKGVMRSFM